MAKDPAYLFYSDNFLSGTMFFSDEQVGKYIRLLCAQHLTGHLEEKNMILICKSYDFEIWKKFVKDDVGLFYNERLENEINKRKAYTESRSKNKKGKKKSKKIIRKSYENHMGNENEIENEDINASSFDLFWKAYPKKKSKGQAEKAWSKINPSKQLLATMIAKIEQAMTSEDWLKDNGQFIPYPASWLNAKGWEDEYAPTGRIISNSSIGILSWAEQKERQYDKEGH
jgi:uncharacterized protein YdaU (DUF1376 family)